MSQWACSISGLFLLTSLDALIYSDKRKKGTCKNAKILLLTFGIMPAPYATFCRLEGIKYLNLYISSPSSFSYLADFPACGAMTIRFLPLESLLLNSYTKLGVVSFFHLGKVDV